MLTSEFNQEMGALIRSLENRVMTEPTLRWDDLDDARASLERAIVALIALRLTLG